MLAPAHVLLVGNDRKILSIRADVLLNFWSIAATTTLANSDLHRAADLVVLCHTLSEDQRHHWITILRAASPNRLIVSLDFQDLGPRNGIDATIDLHRGPAALVSVIYQLLTERGLPSRLWPATGHTIFAPPPPRSL